MSFIANGHRSKNSRATKSVLTAGGGALALAGFMLLAAAPANATETIYVGFSNGSGITQEAKSTTGYVSVAQTYGAFTLNIVSGLSVSNQYLLDSNSINDLKASGHGTIDVYVSETGLTEPLKSDFVSSFTTNALYPNLQISEYTYLDPTDHAYGKTTQLGGVTLTSLTTTIDKKRVSIPSGPYSITEEYVVTAAAGAADAANSTIDLSAVPEPATWAMMIVGLGGVGATLRSRRRMFAANA